MYIDDAHLTAAAVVVRYVDENYDDAPRRDRARYAVICALAADRLRRRSPTIGKSPRLFPFD